MRSHPSWICNRYVPEGEEETYNNFWWVRQNSHLETTFEKKKSWLTRAYSITQNLSLSVFILCLSPLLGVTYKPLHASMSITQEVSNSSDPLSRLKTQTQVIILNLIHLRYQEEQIFEGQTPQMSDHLEGNSQNPQVNTVIKTSSDYLAGPEPRKRKWGCTFTETFSLCRLPAAYHNPFSI